MKQFTLKTALFLSIAAIAAAETAQERLAAAADVFQEIMATPDKGIPQDLLAKAQCVIVIPGLKKGAFVVGGQYGRGFAECRKEDGFGWGAPGAVRVEGGSVGFQIGGSSTDVVMLVMNRHGMEKLLGDKFTLGADASVAAGPVGRTANAATDVRMDAEILAWSRAKGVFAGISLSGATCATMPTPTKSFMAGESTTRKCWAGPWRLQPRHKVCGPRSTNTPCASSACAV